MGGVVHHCWNINDSEGASGTVQNNSIRTVLVIQFGFR